MTLAPDPARWLALASALALLVLSAAFLILPRRDARARLLAAFAALWAAQVAVANLGSAESDVNIARRYMAVNVALLIPLYPLLAYFASAYPLRDGILARSRVALAIALAPAVAAAALMVLSPERMIGEVFLVDGRVAWTQGPLSSWLVSVPFITSLAYAVWRFGRDARASGAPILATRAALIATGFGAYLAYVGPGYFVFYGLEAWQMPTLLASGYAVSYAIGTFALILLARDLWKSAWAGRGKALAFLALAALAGLAESLVILTGARIGTFDLQRIETVGIWRTATVGLVLFALARYQMFDLGARFRLYPPDTAYVRERKLDVYRASLEEALAKVTETEEDRAWLASLRAGLDISEPQHRAIEQTVRAALASGGRPARVSTEAELYRGRFRILRVLGGGGGGQAILAEDARLGRRVVVKELGDARRRDPGAVAALLHEAGIMATISHPNVLTIHEVDRSGEDPVLVMEYCEGGSVQERQLRLGGALAPREAIAIARDTLRGLEAIHARKLVHRDVKPANILLTGAGVAKIADFGLAQTASTFPTATTRGANTTQPGTLPYMSPEQLRGPRIDARSDLYSLAATCYHMLTGHMHYGAHAREPDEIRDAILGHPSDLADAPAWARAWLEKGLAKTRDDRFQSAADMLAALPDPPDLTARA